MPRNDPLIFGPQVCGSLAEDAGAGREWLVTDGLGGYATGTVSGLRTRPEHALLVVADASGVRRTAVAALDLTVTLATGVKVPLYTHQWESGAVDPAGHRHLESFVLADGLPRWRWRIGEVVIERELALRHGHPSLAVVHRVVSAPGRVGLAVAAMCTWRLAGGSRTAREPEPRVEQVADGALVEGAYRLAGPGWQPGGGWHLGARTGTAVEDLWLAGTFCEQAGPGDRLEISAWAGDPRARPPAPSLVLASARDRARRLISTAKVSGYGESLLLAADHFVVSGADGPDVVTCHPDRGPSLSDTGAAYEGLFLDTGRVGEGRDLLIARTRAALRAPAPDIGTGPLWLVHAVDRHVVRTGDTDLAATLALPLGRLLRATLSGGGPLTVDPADGLLTLLAGPDGCLDDDQAPRSAGQDGGRAGKLVEVNALWVNGLAALGDLLAEARRDDGEPRAKHARARESFRRRFPAPEGWLHDAIEGPAAPYPLGAASRHDDPTLRPYQLLAWSLPHAPMRGVGAPPPRAAGEALLTPMGLRTLAPDEYGYRPGHPGQGMVRPWLIGPYADARVAAGYPVDGLLTGLAAHLAEAGLGAIGELAHGDAPHRAAGRPFAALSVAEMLRVEQRYAP
ncbi:glycogen debranching enzyme N-terminal domain-containing protein [Actinoplanes sp. NPDC051851]|uniref:glycogen debranching enzyme N-terminal domain-containing protein n=1 Tax=Actinoplanes sp. NPDC051851 TaxID=3154753 RepID=UPI0034495B1E